MDTIEIKQNGTIRDWPVRLAIADAIIGGIYLEAIQERLRRYDPDLIRATYDEIVQQRSGLEPVSGQEGTAYRKVKKKKPPRAPMPSGLTINEIADKTSISRFTLVTLLEHHGFLELKPYGGRQHRRLVPDNVIEAEYGYNVDPSNRIARVEGYNKAAIFPVFCENRLSDILWCLDYDGIKEKVDSLSSKKDRLAWLLGNHSYLPEEEMALLSGYTVRGVRKAKSRGEHVASI